jgi:hypothetical protein
MLTSLNTVNINSKIPPPIIITPTYAPTNIITRNLIEHLDASYYLGGTTWTNKVYGSSATLYNNPTFVPTSPTYLNFNGTSQYATLPSFSVVLTKYTLETWVKIVSSSPSTQYPAIIAEVEKPGVSSNFNLCLNNLSILTGYLNIPQTYIGNWQFSTYDSFVTGSWCHLVGLMMVPL